MHYHTPSMATSCPYSSWFPQQVSSGPLYNFFLRKCEKNTTKCLSCSFGLQSGASWWHLREPVPICRNTTPQHKGPKRSIANILISDTGGHPQMFFVQTLSRQSSFGNTCYGWLVSKLIHALRVCKSVLYHGVSSCRQISLFLCWGNFHHQFWRHSSHLKIVSQQKIYRHGKKK